MSFLDRPKMFHGSGNKAFRTTIRSILLLAILLLVAYSTQPVSLAMLLWRTNSSVETSGWLPDSVASRIGPFATIAQQLTSVEINNDTASDNLIVKIAKVPSVQELTIDSDSVSDDGLASLKSLPGLVDLAVASERLTDRGISALSDVSSIRRLHVIGGTYTPAGIAQLSRLSDLSVLSLNNTALTDEHIVRIATLGKIHILSVRATGLTDSAAKLIPLQRLSLLDVADNPLSTLPIDDEFLGLISLSVARTNVSDAFCQGLSSCRRLSVLDLSGTRVSDASVLGLSAVSTLQILNIEDTEITQEGAALLAKNLRNCDIQY